MSDHELLQFTLGLAYTQEQINLTTREITSMKRRKFLGFALSSSLLVTIVTAGDNLPLANRSSSRVLAAGEKKVLKLITSPDYPPYEYYDTSGGSRNIVGFDIEIAKKITEKLGYQLEIVESDFNGIIPALQANRADFAMAGMTPTEERKKNVDFSIIYYTAQNTIVSRKGSNIKTTADLKGKKVGVQLGATQEKAAQEIAKKVEGIEIVKLNKVGDLIQELKTKRIDAAIIEDTVAKGYVTNNDSLELNVIPPDGLSGSAIAFPKGSPLVAEFNKILKEMIESKQIEQLAKQWFEKK